MNLLRILDSTPEPPIVDLEIDKFNESGEYSLSTPVYEFQRELTDQIVSLHYSDILKYCETNDKTELIVKSLEICIHNCTLVSSHPYLLITHYMPKNLLQRDMALKLAETSGKFNVLKDLVNVICKCCGDSNGAKLRSSLAGAPNKKTIKSRTERERAKNHKHIGIVLSHINKLIDLVEAVLIGNVTSPIKLKRYVGNFLRRDHKKNEPADADITVHLIPGNYEDIKEDVSEVKLDLLIKFDDLVSDNLVNELRIQNRSSPCNLIKLVPMLSIEHCKIYYQNQEQEPDYLYKLISSIVCLRDQIGILPPDIFPIYNQGLNYLHSFFHKMFEYNVYPTWPLPDLQAIPQFSAIDVEKSLLTEVHFHYTPYDVDNTSNDDDDGFKGKKKTKKHKKTYYELNRLQLNYITNPLTNNYDNLIGIFNHNLKNSDVNNLQFLTHKLMMQINSIYLDYELIKQEYDIHIDYNKDERQMKKIGRRVHELGKSASNLQDDIDHCTSRIDSGNKKYNKRGEDIEIISKEITDMKETIENFTSHEQIKDVEKKVKVIENQLKIWKLSKSVEENIEKIKMKQEEKNYMKKEHENSIESIKTSKTTISELNEISENLHKRLASFRENDEAEVKKFKLERSQILNKIEHERQHNKDLKDKLVKSFRYLRDSSHLKKRKGRGITPK